MFDFKKRGLNNIVERWFPPNAKRVLDAGCSWGHDAGFFSGRGIEAYGIDVNERYVAKAAKKYPAIKFLVCGIEKTPFENDFFDAVILSEVLEHVQDELSSLNEIYRILAVGGTLILTTPHKGLFQFLDPGNFKYYLGYRDKVFHRHYSLNDIRRFLDASAWKGNYSIEVFLGGLFIGAFLGGVRNVLKIIVGDTISRILIKPFSWLMIIDNCISYGRFSYHIALRLTKER